MLLIDGKRVIVGSINLAPGSFDSRRELAIDVRDAHVVKRMQKVVHHDWKHSHPLDLTDEGLRAELEAHKIEVADRLALDDDRKRKKRKKK
jgi:phosphatidylserine/phosphatidylglycerophosphate/cardiolipin synthase-like enzyme